MKDSMGLLRAALDLSEQLREGWSASQGVENLPPRDRIENVVILGMGASGVAGDIVRAVAQPLLPLPVVVVRNYELPAFVGEGTLAFAVSYSGNTEETLATATEAVNQGAKLVAISSGGRLAEMAIAQEFPLVRLRSNLEQPRAALGLMTSPILGVLEKLGLFPGAGEWVAAAANHVESRRDELGVADGPAAQLAEQLAGKNVVVYGGGTTGFIAARRWKTVINENAKTPSFFAEQPELCHNEVVGWEATSEELARTTAVVALRHGDEHPQVFRRFELTEAHIAPHVSAYHTVEATGDGEFTQLFDLIAFGDFVSLHMARLTDVDPGPVPFLDELKAALADG